MECLNNLMEYSVEFIKYITDYGELKILKLHNNFIAKCSTESVKAANIETALMLLLIKLKNKK